MHGQALRIQREQAEFASKNLSGLWPSHELAQKLGQKLGQRAVLQ
jgi:hypothetical protein